MDRAVTVACAQAEPVILDRERTLDKLEAVASEAARNGAELVVFPETFVPVYPSSRWAKAFAGWQNEGAKETFARLAQNSVAVGSRAELRLGACARELGIWLVTGVNEVEAERPGTIYNALLYHAPDGSLALHHRKLVPTNHERLVWGRRRRLAVDARAHRSRESGVRRLAERVPACVVVSRRLRAEGRARRDGRARPRRQRDPRAGRLVPRRTAVRRGGDPVRDARPDRAPRRAAALRPGRALPPAGSASARRQPRCSRGRCDAEYTSFRLINPPSIGKTSTPSHSTPRALAVHSQTAKSSPTRRSRVEKRRSGLLAKMRPMCSRTASAPSALSSAVWLWKTTSGWCMDAIASRSCAFHASL